MEKAKIANGMITDAGDRRVRGDSTILKDGVTLGDFATQRTRKILSRLNIEESFLDLPPETWDENDDYKKGLVRVTNLRIVHDTAERDVKLFEEFNNLITNDEEEKTISSLMLETGGCEVTRPF